VATKQATELRDLNDERLASRLEEAREALFNLRFQHAGGALERTSEIAQRKREIARILTIVHQREVEAAHG
jgi:large subunit ribosomal protein L29